jgi:hypothetical protein
MKITLQLNIKSAAILTSIFFLFQSPKIFAQTTPSPVSAYIDINDVKALMYSDGTSFWNPGTSLPQYFVPKTGSACTIFTGALWVGGLDEGGRLHMAAETYKQNGTDFWPGPIMNSSAYSSHQDSVWNKVWEVNKTIIDSFRRGQCTGIPASIANWPGNGDTSLGESATLAPYYDSNHNGKYDPTGGDYPAIRGDQAMLMIYNDARGTHTETGSIPLGIEVHLMAYQYNVPSNMPVYQTTFLHYDIINRSTHTYRNSYLGYYCDMDIGNGSNDYIGCDSINDYWYTYNGTATDPNGSGEVGYGGPTPPPPAEAVAYLCDTMSHFIYYNNDFSGMGNPMYEHEYYNYMQSIWRDSTHMTFGGNGHNSGPNQANFMFTGDPNTLFGWSEVKSSDAPGDRRGLSSTGPSTFIPGETKSVDMALVYSRATSGDQNTSVSTLATAVQSVKTFYSSQGYACGSLFNSVDEIPNNKVTSVLYPDPFSTKATLFVNSSAPLKNANLQIFDVTGRAVYSQPDIHENNISIERGNLKTGLYFYQLIEDGRVLVNGKFIVQ